MTTLFILRRDVWAGAADLLGARVGALARANNVPVLLGVDAHGSKVGHFRDESLATGDLEEHVAALDVPAFVQSSVAGIQKSMRWTRERNALTGERQADSSDA